MIQIHEKQDCTGCYACYNICPQKCISIQSDREGFWYPIVYEKLCIKCGLCKKICPILHKKESLNTDPETYACINKKENIRKKSSSGGMFTVFAEYVLERGGIVFGAGFDENFNVVHSWVEDKENLDKFRGSKYVQSKIGSTYEEAQAFLRQGRLVLFTGTPCQISGLKAYLGREYEDLLCVDIICHGVPSPLVWIKYVEFQRDSRKKIRQIDFRSKHEGWKMFSMHFYFDDNSEYRQNVMKDLYMKGFLENLYLRPSCYSCKFKTINRQSDITIADFWGINNILPEMDDDKGTSLVILHSQKGKEIFAKTKQGIVYKGVDFEQAIQCNSAMIQSVEENIKRQCFFNAINDEDKSVAELIDQYTRVSRMKRIYRGIRSCLGKIKRSVLQMIR